MASRSRLPSSKDGWIEMKADCLFKQRFLLGGDKMPSGSRLTFRDYMRLRYGMHITSRNRVYFSRKAVSVPCSNDESYCMIIRPLVALDKLIDPRSEGWRNAQEIMAKSHEVDAVCKILGGGLLAQWDDNVTNDLGRSTTAMDHLFKIVWSGQPGGDGKHDGEEANAASSTQAATPSPTSYGMTLRSWKRPASALSVSDDDETANAGVQRESRTNIDWQKKGDEQTNNACIVAFLIGLAYLDKRGADVHMDRRPFTTPHEPKKARDPKDKGVLLTAAVDGLITQALIIPPDRDACLKQLPTRCIIETKREIRIRDQYVKLQEGAEMASLVREMSAYHTTSLPLALAALGRCQAGLTFASFDANYVKSLTHKKPRHQGFMELREPDKYWDLRRSAQMREWLTVMLVLIRRSYGLPDSANAPTNGAYSSTNGTDTLSDDSTNGREDNTNGGM